MSPLYDILQQIHPLPAEFWDELNSTVTERDVPRKTRLLHQGAISNEIFFIIKGIISVNSFFRRIPSQESIELLEDSRLISITYDQLHELYKKYVAFNFIGRVLTENYYILSEQRIYSMRMQTARERYELLQSTDPFIFQRVPLKYIASYLSMKPETLSRIRAAR
jgi:CRP-like cAMP-binding protein